MLDMRPVSTFNRSMGSWGWRTAAAGALGVLASLVLLPGVAPAAPPANDDFANARQLSGGLPLSFTGSFLEDTRELGEPADHGEGLGPGAGTVWFSWTATETATVKARFRSTAGLSVYPNPERPFMAAYTGSALGSLTPVPVRFSESPWHVQGSPIEFDVTQGVTYRLVAEAPGEGTFTAEIRAVSVPSNDLPAEPEDIGGSASETFSDDNFDATAETEYGGFDELDVWYRWTAPFSGQATLHWDNRAFRLPRFGFDPGSKFYAYRIDGVGARRLVSTHPPNNFDQAYFDAKAGHSYLIAATSPGEGPFTGSLVLERGPGNDDFRDAIQLTGGSGQVVNGTTVRATEEPGEPQYTEEPGWGTVWYRWTAPITGNALVDPSYVTQVDAFTGDSLQGLQPAGQVVDGSPGYPGPPSTFPIVAGTEYRFSVRTDLAGGPSSFSLTWAPAPSNDRFATPLVLSGSSPPVHDGTLQGATMERDELHPRLGASSVASTWYEWTPTQDLTAKARLVDANGYSIARDRPSVNVYVGDDLDDLTAVTEPYPGDPGRFRAVAGTTYRIAVADTTRSDYRLRLRTAPPPAGDDLADAVELLGVAPAASGTTAGGTIEVGESARLSSDPVLMTSVWYRWTAPRDGRAWVSLDSRFVSETSSSESGSGSVAAFTGDSIDDLVPRGSEARPGRYRFDVTAGSEYRIAVFSRYSEGPFDLSLEILQPPPNDDFAAALPLVGPFPRQAAGELRVAGTEPSEPDHGGDSAASSVWFAFDPPDSGRYRLGTCGDLGSQNVVGAVYTGVALGSLQPVAHTSEQSCVVDFDATAGTMYRIAVDGRRSYQGSDSFALSLSRISVERTVLPGGSVSTGETATRDDPQQAGVTSPTGGRIEITKGAGGSAPVGFEVVGARFSISAPPATAAAPLILEFTVDGSIAPAQHPLASFTLLRDGTPVADCTGPGASPDPCVAGRSRLPDGDLRIRVLSSHASAWDVVRDSTGPTVRFESPPSLTNERQPAVRFTTSEPAETVCSVDGRAPAPCESPYQLSGLGEGEHDLAVVATDRAQNAGPTATHRMTIDLTAPRTARLKLVGKASVRGAKFKFSAKDAASFECALDKGKFARCRSPFRVKRLKPGKHRLLVRATDEAGNVERKPAALKFRVSGGR